MSYRFANVPRARLLPVESVGCQMMRFTQSVVLFEQNHDQSGNQSYVSSQSNPVAVR